MNFMQFLEAFETNSSDVCQFVVNICDNLSILIFNDI